VTFPVLYHLDCDVITEYLSLKSLAISSHVGQERTVITVNQAMYCRLVELKWFVPEHRDKFMAFVYIYSHEFY